MMRHNLSKWMVVIGFVSAGAIIYNIAPPVWAQAKQAAPTRSASMHWQSYRNARFGYRLRYPASLLVPQGEADNGDGQVFLSPNAKTKLLVYGSNNALDETITTRFAQERRDGTDDKRKKRVTYSQQKANGYVVSGYENGKIFYRRCYLVDDHFVTFEITYPKAERTVWDKIVTRIGQEFQP